MATKLFVFSPEAPRPTAADVDQGASDKKNVSVCGVRNYVSATSCFLGKHTGPACRFTLSVQVDPVSFRLHLSPSHRRPISSQRPLVTKKRKQVETPLANRLRGLLPWRVATWTCRALATRSAVRTSCTTDQDKATCWWPNPGLSSVLCLLPVAWPCAAQWHGAGCPQAAETLQPGDGPAALLKQTARDGDPRTPRGRWTHLFLGPGPLLSPSG